jgi:hypothetical protein
MNDKFEEYEVVITPLERPDPQIFLHIWAASSEDAQTCGEILTAVYMD